MRDLGGSLRSVLDTLLHIIGGQWGWLTYWKAPSHSAAFLADMLDRHDALFKPSIFPDVTAVRGSGRKSKNNRRSLSIALQTRH